MPRYIDADALEKELHLLCNKYNISFGGESKGFGAELATIANKLPADDVRPERHGKWEIGCDGYYPYCSKCGKEPQERVMTDFCPNCGAKMDGRDGNKND